MKSYFLVAGLALLSACRSSQEKGMQWCEQAIATSEQQLLYMAQQLKDEPDTLCFPRSVREDGTYRLEKATDWVTGFYAGSMWLAYEMTGNEQLAEQARCYTNRLSDMQHYTGNHDLGFMMFCSYGQGIRLKPEVGDSLVLLHSAESLAKRFCPKTGLIRSWDFGEWSYPVIIDNMMNLEMLFWVAEHDDRPELRRMAISHADKTLQNHFREDMTSYHVVSYVAETGEVESKGTFQGYADSSAWSRGQAWGVYGYTMCYRFTKNIIYLEAAHKIAQYIMTHRPAEDDYVPYWDYDAPDIPNAPRDASAAAVTAAALLELCGYGTAEQGETYFRYAEQILKQLSSDEYLAKPGENHGFILKHSVGSYPHHSEIDVPLVYADYYYLEALDRYRTAMKNRAS